MYRSNVGTEQSISPAFGSPLRGPKGDRGDPALVCTPAHPDDLENYETGQQELSASNEELRSANEELRSTMEELETSKEELQSVNEESGAPFEMTFRVQTKDGIIRWLYTRGAISASDGNSLHMHGASIDITARLQAESALRQSEQRFRALVDVSAAMLDDQCPRDHYGGLAFLARVHRPDVRDLDQPGLAQCGPCRQPRTGRKRLAPVAADRLATDERVC